MLLSIEIRYKHIFEKIKGERLHEEKKRERERVRNVVIIQRDLYLM